jgi:hypothetical protein
MGITGEIRTEEHRKNLSNSLRGRKVWNMGGHHSEETKQKISESLKKERVGYFALHYRVRKAKGKANRCDQCGLDNKNRRYEWANLTGDFYNMDDYKSMCHPCHKKYDYEKTKVNNTAKVPA